MKRIPVLIFWLSLLLVLAACGSQRDELGREIIFEEHFEASYSDLWAFSGDIEELAIIEGVLIGPSGGLAQMCVGEEDWQDYTVSLWLDHIEGSVALFVRFNSWSDTYGLYIAEGFANLFWRYDNDAKTLVDSVDEVGEAPVALSLQVEGNQISTMVDGDEFYTFVDDQLSSGSLCLELTGEVRIDDIVVTVP